MTIYIYIYIYIYNVLANYITHLIYIIWVSLNENFGNTSIVPTT